MQCFCWVLTQTTLVENTRLNDMYTRGTRPCAILIPAWGSIWGLRVFPVIKIIVVRQVRVLPVCTAVWAWRQTRIKCCALVRNDRERICFVFALPWVVSKNPKSPKLSPMADNAITRGGIGSLVSLVYICELNTSQLSAVRRATRLLINWLDVVYHLWDWKGGGKLSTN